MVDKIEHLLWLLATVATAVLVYRMWREQLIRNYRAFFFFNVLSFIAFVVMSQMSRRTNFYAYTYMGIEAARWLLYILITLELFTVVLKNYPGIATAGKRFVTASLAISLIISILSLTVLSTAVETPGILDRFFVLDRLFY